MRITLVSPFDPFPSATAAKKAHVGGVERVFAEVAPRIAAKGHEVTLLSSTDGPSRTDQLDRIQVVRVRRRGTIFRAPLVDLGGQLPEDTELVHVPATYPFTTPRMLKQAQARGIPSVLDFHFEPTVEPVVGRIAARLYRLLGPRQYRLADRVMVRSIEYGRSAPSLAGSVPEDRWRVVPNGIDPDRFHPQAPVPDGAPEEGYLLFVGRLVPYKGLPVLLEALGRARLGLPLVIIGDGPLRPRLERMAQRLGIDVRFLGHVPDEALPGYYRGARLTVLPSVNGQEAFGISLVESMACGTRVVGSALPGVRAVASFGGRVAPPGDARALAEAIRYALEDDHLEAGVALADRTHRQYSWDAVTDRMLSVYAEAMDGDGADRSRPQEVSPDAHPRRHAVLRT